MASAPPAVTLKDPVVDPNVIGLPRVMFPAALKVTADPGLKLTDEPLVVMVPAAPGADRLKGALTVLVMAPLMTILPLVAVAEKPRGLVEARVSGPAMLIAVNPDVFAAIIAILPVPDVASVADAAVENDPLAVNVRRLELTVKDSSSIIVPALPAPEAVEIVTLHVERLVIRFGIFTFAVAGGEAGKT
jgi:hypothetical protein